MVDRHKPVQLFYTATYNTLYAERHKQFLNILGKNIAKSFKPIRNW